MQTTDPVTAFKIAEAAFEVAKANHRALSDEWMNLPKGTDRVVAEELRQRVLALSDIAYDAKIAAYKAERASGLDWTVLSKARPLNLP